MPDAPHAPSSDERESSAARRLSRRSVLRSSAVVGSAALMGHLGAAPGFARSPGRSVAVLGGGMAGLATAHELVERGYDVTVFEPTAWGGKARSIAVPGSATGGRKELPGEHGFRFFPGFYHHVPDSMRRTPFPGNANGVWDNLVDATEGKFVRDGEHADAFIFGIGPDPQALLSVEGLRRYLTQELSGRGVPPHELAYFVERVLVFVTSCDARRFGQWEKVSWWDFLGAGSRSEEYQKVLAAGLTRNLVAAKETVASTRTIGNMGEAFVFTMAQQGNDGQIDRVLDLPTNEAWIDPWVAQLRSLGVRFVSGQGLAAYETDRGRIRSVQLTDAAGRRTRFSADWFVSAMPVEQARRFWSPAVRTLDPHLGAMDDLFTDWMVGIQFYLRKPVGITRGHVTFVDSPWALTALTQGQFWEDRQFTRDYGKGDVVDSLSVDVSNWDAPGVLFDKPAKRCTPDEIAQEVLAQIRLHPTAAAELPDDVVHSWFLDPGIQWDAAAGRNTNATPLLVNTVNTWEKRPKARTAIPNLFLAGDYVQTNIDLATMEGANESGRAAANALLDASGSPAEQATMFQLYRSPALEAVKQTDAALYTLGRPNALDVPVG